MDQVTAQYGGKRVITPINDYAIDTEHVPQLMKYFFLWLSSAEEHPLTKIRSNRQNIGYLNI